MKTCNFSGTTISISLLTKFKNSNAIKFVRGRNEIPQRTESALPYKS
jgi:hypothetical protein